MAKAQREISAALRHVDFVLELLDARIPLSSQNPDLARLTQGRPLISLLNKADLADEAVTARFLEYFAARERCALACDCKSGAGLGPLGQLARTLLKPVLERDAARGVRRPLRAMVVGVPNVGKSALINRLCGKAKTKVENRPGVTRILSWTRTSMGFELLDTPGVLWPKFSARTIGENLALTGAVRDEVLSAEELAAALLNRLRALYPAALSERFGIGAIPDDCEETLCAVAKRRGLLLSGGVADSERAAALLVEEFRAGKLGRISLETPNA